MLSLQGRSAARRSRHRGDRRTRGSRIRGWSSAVQSWQAKRSFPQPFTNQLCPVWCIEFDRPEVNTFVGRARQQQTVHVSLLAQVAAPCGKDRHFDRLTNIIRQPDTRLLVIQRDEESQISLSESRLRELAMQQDETVH